MSEMLEVKCSCGQTTHFVRKETGWIYDQVKHGSSAARAGLCFNCHKKLEHPAFASAKGETSPTGEEAVKTQTPEKAPAQPAKAKGVGK